MRFKRNCLILFASVFLVTSLSSCGSNSGYYIEERGKTYKYKLELTGRTPNAAKDSKFIVYTDDKDLTFDEAAHSIFTSNSNEVLDIYIESWEVLEEN